MRIEIRECDPGFRQPKRWHLWRNEVLIGVIYDEGEAALIRAGLLLLEELARAEGRTVAGVAAGVKREGEA